MFAFMAPAIDVIKGQVAEPKLPAFKPRWWYRNDRLDARPVAWSLRNHPEEWEADHPGYTIRHKPSGHRFWIANGKGCYRLYSANCSCMDNGGRFQRFQQGVFHHAYREWSAPREAARAAKTREQFIGHFIH